MSEELQRKQPSFRQITERLQRELRLSTYDHDNEQECDGVLTLSYGKFCNLAKRALLTKRLYVEVELEAARLGLVVVFGEHAVVVADDSDFAANGLPTLDATYVRHPRRGRQGKLTNRKAVALLAYRQKQAKGIVMKRLMMACLLAVSGHAWAADLHPDCYTLYDQYLTATDWSDVGRISDKMHDRHCWPALQGVGNSENTMAPATDCNSLVPHVIKMVNDQAHINGYSILQVADAKAMTYETIDRVADGHDIFITVTDNKGRSARGRQGLKHDDTAYVHGKGYYTSPEYAYNDDGVRRPISPAYYTYGNDGAVLTPNSAPFAASPLTGSTRVLNCSAEAQYTQGVYMIQMTLDRNPDDQEFIGMQVLMELR